MATPPRPLSQIGSSSQLVPPPAEFPDASAAPVLTPPPMLSSVGSMSQMVPPPADQSPSQSSVHSAPTPFGPPPTVSSQFGQPFISDTESVAESEAAPIAPPPMLSQAPRMSARITTGGSSLFGGDAGGGLVSPPPLFSTMSSGSILSTQSESKGTYSLPSAQRASKAIAGFKGVSDDVLGTLFIQKTVLNALGDLQQDVGPHLSNLLLGGVFRNPDVDPMPYIQLSKFLDSWSLFTLEQLAKRGYADVVIRALLCWLPSTNLSRSAACELSTLQNPNTGKYSFDTFIHSLEGYANVDDVLGELTETVVELIVADILVMITTYTGGDPISDDMAQHLIYTAYSGLLRPVNKRNENLFTVIQHQRMQQWNALLGNITPKHAARLLSILLDFILGRGSTQAVSETQLPVVLQSIMHIRINLEEEACRDAVSQFVTALISILDDGFGRIKRNKDDAAQHKVMAGLLSLHYVLQACNFEESGLNEMLADDVVRSLMSKMELLFERLDEMWNPVKSQHNELGDLCNLAMTTLLNRCSKTFYGGKLEFFMTKRILKNCYDNDADRRDNAFACLIRLLRGPRYKEPVPILRRKLARLRAMDVQKEEKRGGTFLATDHKYACITPKFPGNETNLFRPDCLNWIQEKLFEKKARGKVKDMYLCADRCADVLLGMFANYANAGFIRPMLDYREHKSLDFLVVVMRTIRIMLDPKSKFLEHASQTRANAHMGEAVHASVEDIRAHAVRAIREFLPEILKTVGVPSNVEVTKEFVFKSCIGDENVANQDDAKNDVIRHLDPKVYNEEKKIKLMIVQEVLRALPFLDFEALIPMIFQGGLVHHPEDSIVKSLSCALQNTMLHQPHMRGRVISAVATYAERTRFSDAVRVKATITLQQGLVRNWKALIAEGLDGRPRGVAAADEDVLERTKAEYPSWTAHVEAISLLVLCHPDPAMRDIALGTFRDLMELREAQRQIVEIFGTEERRQLEEEFRSARANTLHRGSTMQRTSVGQSTKSLSTASESQHTEKPAPIPALEEGSFCVYDFIQEQGADIVQRALHRFLLEQTGGIADPNTKAFAASAPSLEKVSMLSTEMWYFALPELAHRVLRYAHPSVVEEARKTLYIQLTEGGNRLTINANMPNKELWKAQMTLMLSIASNPTEVHDHVQHLSLEEHGSGQWALGRYSNPLEKLQQFLGICWPLLLERSDAWISCFETALHASSIHAVGPVVRSLRAWIHSMKDRKVRQVIPVVLKLLRTLSDSGSFVEALSADGAVMDEFIGLLLDDVLPPSDWWQQKDSDSWSLAVLDSVMVANRLCDAILEANYNWAEKRDRWQAKLKQNPDGEQEALPPKPPCLNVIYRAKLYRYLRDSHAWPPPNLFGNATPAAPRKHPSRNIEITTFRFALQAVSKVLQMGQTLQGQDIATLMAESGFMQLPVETQWFLAAERTGAFCFRWILAYHHEHLAPGFFQHVYKDSREDAMVYFQSIVDQLLPTETVAEPPNTGVTEQSTEYFKKIAHWGVTRDLGVLKSADVCRLDKSAVHKANVFGDGIFRSDDPFALNEMALLLLGLRAIMDPTTPIRYSAFKLIRHVVLSLYSRSIDDIVRQKGKKTPEQADRLEMLQEDMRNFGEFMSRLYLSFASDSGATLEIEALQIVHKVADCLKDLGRVKDFFAEVFARAGNREEWGGHDWTATVAATFASYVELCERDEDGEILFETSEYGQQFLESLFKLSAQIPAEEHRKCIPMWHALVHGDEHTVQMSSKDVHPNLHAVIQFLLYITGSSGQAITICQEVALVCFRAHAPTAARWFSFPLTHKYHFGAVRENFTDEDRTTQCESGIILLAGLVTVNLEPILPFLPAILNFAVVHFPTSTRFVAEGSGSGVSDFRQRFRLPSLLHNILSALQPILAKKEKVKIETLDKINTLLAILRTGMDVRHMTLDWTRAISDIAEPLKPDSPDVPISEARSFGGLCPRAMVRDIVGCFRDVSPDLAKVWGLEVMQWAMQSTDFSTVLKSHVIFSALGLPADASMMTSLVRHIAKMMSVTEAYDSNKSVFCHEVPTSITSTAQYQDIIRTCAALHSLLVLAGTVGTRYDAVTDMPALFWAAATIIRTAQGSHELKFTQYALRLLQQLLKHSKDVHAAMACMEATAENYAGGWDLGFTGLLPLLVPLILSTNADTARIARDVAVTIAKNSSSAVDHDPVALDLRLVGAVLPFLADLASEKPSPVAVAFANRLKEAVLSREDNGALAALLDEYVLGCSSDRLLEEVARWLYTTRRGKLAKLSPILQMMVTSGTATAQATALRLVCNLLKLAEGEVAEVLEMFNTVVRKASLITLDVQKLRPSRQVHAAAVSTLEAAAAAFVRLDRGDMKSLGDLAANQSSGLRPLHMDVASLLADVADTADEIAQEALLQIQRVEESEGESEPDSPVGPPPADGTPAAGSTSAPSAPPPDVEDMPPPPIDELPIFKLKTDRRASAIADDTSDPGPPPPEDDEPEKKKDDDANEGNLVPVKDHPKYERFFNLLAMRVPIGQIQNVMESVGLDVALLSEPEKLIPL